MRLVAIHVRRIMSLLVIFMVQSSVFAQITTYLGDDSPRNLLVNSLTARDAFINSFTLTGTENFESYAPFTLPPFLTFGPATATTTTTNAFFVIDDSGIGTPFSVSHSSLLLGNFLDNNVFGISRPVNGFGLFFVNVGDAVVNQFTLDLFSNQTGITKSISVNFNGNGTGVPTMFGPGRNQDDVFFFGVRDTDPFDQVTIRSLYTDGSDGVLYDDISIGFIIGVPEPTTYALLVCLGVIAVGIYRYQKQKQLKAQDVLMSE